MNIHNIPGLSRAQRDKNFGKSKPIFTYVIFTENKGFRRGFYHISIGLELSGTKVHGALTWAVSFWGSHCHVGRLENMLKSQEGVSLLLEHRAQLEALVGDTSNTGPIVDQYQIL